MGVAVAGRAGLIVREWEPVNLEAPFEQMDGLITPTELFYVRSHFHAPELDAAEHRLRVGGAVRQPFEISLKEVRAMPAVTRTATLECAGNGRIFLIPQVGGAQWELGAVSTAEWTGVPLAGLLERAGLEPDVCELVLEGVDRGMPREPPVPPGETRYARSLPVGKAKDVMIAYAVNGEALPRDHGFPLRAIVPGHYGMASVKWLCGIRAVRSPFRGYFQTTDYAYWAEEEGHPVRRALGVNALKSAIAQPRTREVLPAGTRYVVRGAAWGSETHVASVEISSDGGERWAAAEMLDPVTPGVWRRWRYNWAVPAEPGRYALMSRATDAEGNRQPSAHDKHFGTYVIHHTLPIEVEVR